MGYSVFQTPAPSPLLVSALCFWAGMFSAMTSFVFSRLLVSNPTIELPKPVVVEPEKPPVPKPPEEPLSQVVLSGKVSTFGGPDDRGLGPDEGLAIIEPNRLASYPNLQSLFLPYQPEGTTGLARRLDPSKYYLACRWNYSVTPKSWLRVNKVSVSANGKTIDAQPIDWGPASSTGRVCDLSPGLANALSLKTDDVCTVKFTPPKAEQPILDGPGGPPWLARAKALEGLYELPGDADNPVILEMAKRCGGNIAKIYTHDAIAWCALFANYCLKASGQSGTDSLWALDFANYGQKLNGPAVGAIASKKRSGGGHVFFVVGRTSKGTLVGVGGNQSDMVNEVEYDPSEIVAYTWPEGVALPTTGFSSLPVVSVSPAIKKEVTL